MKTSSISVRHIAVRHIVAVAAIAISSSAVASAQYKFVRLNVPGASSTLANGINNNNVITGTYANSSGTFGFTYDPGTGVWHYPISDPKAVGNTALNSSNTSGQIVGYYYSQAIARDVGMVMQPGGSFSDVTPIGCTTNAVVTGINDGAFSTMGGHCQTAQGVTLAWESYPANLAFSCFGSTYTEANAINNWALMAGTYTKSDGMSSGGFISTDQGTCSEVDYPGAASTTLGGINDTGTITGSYWPNFAGAYHGFVLTGSTFAAVDVPKAKATSIGQVNNNNWFVGFYIDHKNQMHSFYAMPIAGASMLVESEN